MKNRTVLMAAHRISTAISADKIVVIKNGNIVDMGSHHELIERCAYYKKLCDIQLSDDFSI